MANGRQRRSRVSRSNRRISSNSNNKYRSGGLANNGIHLSNNPSRVNRASGGTIRKYQYGGGVGNQITQTNLQAGVGQYVYQHNSQPYIGVYHVHADGTRMIGAGMMGVTHDIISNEVIVPVNQTQTQANLRTPQPTMRTPQPTMRTQRTRTQTMSRTGGSSYHAGGRIKRRRRR